MSQVGEYERVLGEWSITSLAAIKRLVSEIREPAQSLGRSTIPKRESHKDDIRS